MRIKQQKQIKAFLVGEFGKDRGCSLFDRQSNMLSTLIKNTRNKSKNQMKTLIGTILPGIALYKVLSEEDLSEETVTTYMEKYMFDHVAANMHSSMKKMEIIPGFYFLYSTIFLRVMRHTDLQESVQSHGKDYFDVTITKCLWRIACAENGCPQLCHIFCDADNVTYGGLKKLAFSRTKTLGHGKDCCDFHFYKKQG